MKDSRRWLVLSIVVFAMLSGLLLWRTNRGGDEGSSSELVCYCAAGVKAPVARLARDFEQAHGIRIRLQYGGSGTLLSNLQVAREGDLYLAADNSYLNIAREKDLLDETVPLAHMRPVIAVPRGNPKQIAAVSDLLRPGMRVALGNPEAASIGKQTRQLLRDAGLWEQLEGRVRSDGVFKPTVPEVANDVKLGAVDAGVVWDATVSQYPELEAVEVPEFMAGNRSITIGVLTASHSPTTALRFARYLNSTVGNQVFREHGYRPVEGDEWSWSPEITFFCGAVNRRAVDQVIHDFEQREGVTVNTVYNGCGILTGQMRTIRDQEGGAGFPDVYMACDRFYLDNVAEWFQEDINVSEADIVIAVPKGNPKNVQGLADLAKPGIRVAVGQPQQCTIGALTRILLEKEGMRETVMRNVATETASSAMLVPSVTTHAVDAAIAYVTDTGAESDKVDAVFIDSPHAHAVQPFSIARSSKHKYLGRRLMRRVLAAGDAFREAGFRFVADPEPTPEPTAP